MKADGVALALQDGTLEVVVEQNAGDAVPGGERADMAAQEALKRGVEGETQEDLPRVAEHHDEGHQGPHRTADRVLAEVSPIDLPLLTGQRGQAQIGLGLGTRTVARDHVAEVVGATGIAAFAHHGVEAAGGERRELLKGAEDEWEVGIDA